MGSLRVVVIDDREVHVGELGRYLAQRGGIRESDGDDRVVAGRGEQGQPVGLLLVGLPWTADSSFVWTFRSALAFSRPAAARSLKDLSPRPPTSYAEAHLDGLLGGATRGTRSPTSTAATAAVTATAAGGQHHGDAQPLLPPASPHAIRARSFSLSSATRGRSAASARVVTLAPRTAQSANRRIVVIRSLHARCFWPVTDGRRLPVRRQVCSPAVTAHPLPPDKLS